MWRKRSHRLGLAQPAIQARAELGSPEDHGREGLAGHASYDPATDRADAAEIVAQARWLFEQHERRSDSAQKIATAVLAFTGTVVTFVIKGVSSPPDCWQVVGMAAILLSGLVTATMAVLALVPRTRTEGMPSIKDLRKLAAAHDNGEEIAIPVNQFAADLLHAKRLDLKSPLEHARDTADLRMNRLQPALFSLGVTFALAMTLMFLVAVVP